MHVILFHHPILLLRWLLACSLVGFGSCSPLPRCKHLHSIILILWIPWVSIYVQALPLTPPWRTVMIEARRATMQSHSSQCPTPIPKQTRTCVHGHRSTHRSTFNVFTIRSISVSFEQQQNPEPKTYLFIYCLLLKNIIYNKIYIRCNVHYIYILISIYL